MGYQETEAYKKGYIDSGLASIQDPKILQYEHIPTQEEVRKHIQECEGRHTQQAIYSTFHDALTQICFGCMKVRSTIRR